MKKIYLCAMALSVGSLSFGQQLVGKQFTENMSQLSKDNGQTINTASSNNKAPGDIIWSEDFTGGFPAGWSVLDNTGNGFDWVLDPGSANVVADFTNTAPIASNSGGNYMLMNADGYNSPIPAGGAVEMDSYFQTSAITLAGQAGVSVTFQQKFRRCCANVPAPVINLSVSTDPTFATNVMDYDINGGISTNDASPDPMDMSINITAIAGGLTGDIYLRFHLVSGSSHYFWMIDDIAVVESPINDMVAINGFYGFFGVQYTRIPFDHVQPISFSYQANNIGVANQTNTSLSADISTGAGSVYSGNSTPITFVSLATDTFELDSVWTPSAAIVDWNVPYTVTLEIVSDSVDFTPANN
ncbi:MAG: hypothetical protein HRU26_13900, partial [Psychroserpens sp.]|nr:hypothetical protein [Psychroserpens sp.]